MRLDPFSLLNYVLLEPIFVIIPRACAANQKKMIYLIQSNNGYFRRGAILNSRHIGEHSQGNGQNRSNRRIDYLFLLLLLLAILTMLIALIIASAVFLSTLISIPLDSFLPNQYLPPDQQLYLSAGFLLLMAILFAIVARWRIRRNRSYQFVNGCPVCREHDMIRIHRRSKHRIMATVFRLPIRNYACRNCQWQGVLLFYPPVGEITEAEALPDPIKSDGVQAIQTGADDQDLSTVKPALPSSNNDQGLLEHESLQDQPEARSRDQLSLLTAEPDHDLIHEAKPEGNESPQDNDLILAVEENVSFPSQPAGTVAASAVTSAEDDNLTRVESRRERCNASISRYSRKQQFHSVAVRIPI